jgi:hypothetical protein
MNGQIRWHLYHTQQTEGDEVRQIRRHPRAISEREASAYAQKNCQEVDLGPSRAKALGQGFVQPATPPPLRTMAPEDRSHGKIGGPAGNLHTCRHCVYQLFYPARPGRLEHPTS